MIEEHLDEEYQNSQIVAEFSRIKGHIKQLENNEILACLNKEMQIKLGKAIALLHLHVQNYQRIIIFNRRKARLRLRKRRFSLRNALLHSLMEMQIRFIEMLPLTVEPAKLLDNTNAQREENGIETTAVCTEDKHAQAQESPKNVLNFYNDIVSLYTTDQWLHTFHMSKNIFDLICSRLKTSLDNIDMGFENWIAMCIYMFASGSKWSSVALLFNVEAKFVRQSVFRFSECLLNEFADKLTMPNNTTELESIASGFYKASDMMPCVAGVLSLFKVPNECGCKHLDNCGSELIKVQVCIDHNLLIRKVETTSHKPTMFLRSPNEISLYTKKFTEENCEIPYFIVAPSNYPLRNWLMQKFDNPRKHWEYDFNKSCGSLNIYREITLKRLFGRWHILNSTECILPESKTFIIKACCLLHNIMEEHKEDFSLEWCTNFIPAKYECRIPPTAPQYVNDSKTAIEQRNIIATFMNTLKTNNRY